MEVSMRDNVGLVAAVLGLALSAAGVVLTVFYGRQCMALLQEICKGLTTEGRGNR
jgi:hypothetical protein